MDKGLQSEGKMIDVQQMIEENKRKKTMGERMERVIPFFLLLCAAVSVLTTAGILFTLLRESIGFFSEVNLFDFYTGTQWSPWSGEYGIAPLIGGTLLITLIATVVAVPLGLMSAIFLSEYASDRVRRIIKPILEVLAGIPTVVYGYFALTFITPLFQSFIPDLGIFNAMSAGVVVGIMIIPMIASLSEDAMNSVPNALREGAYGLGATKLEVVFKVVLPAAFSGIVASVVLAVSRAIGETMIVTIAAGATPNMTFNPTESIQTMTAFIVQAATGDTTFGSTIYYSLYAVGMTLFVFTLVMNLIAQFISRRFREEY
ncbi:phosphate ABC transporter permease subunit PstC [Halobacillus sp. ACCC02827]|uniref:phosphate ABC transporter permease subunit PstC n=1 Tax=Bacillaceae TaxID=186817 RepID=UPI0002A4FB1D|nr:MULTISPECIES: phosphate ABC transporter permease subunit PstC [Bacillaceae]ELK46207.1 putative substrate phosphate ABC transporter permease [Halobacillus sp. BAB-2008]QHT47171.1 phosphate ABC transporter permease subunit PstC [Bacillus sp. SB49]WJE14401.1 phosphate ABC transporter permease subunit PstC [Halobacillus sp. ACCC02827]